MAARLSSRMGAYWREPPREDRGRRWGGSRTLLAAGLGYAVLAVVALVVVAALPKGVHSTVEWPGATWLPDRVTPFLGVVAGLLERPGLLAGMWILTAASLVALGTWARRGSSPQPSGGSQRAETT